MAIAMRGACRPASLLIGLAALAMPSVVSAQSVAVSGDPAVLTVGTATAGREPDPARDAATTYTVTTTAANQKLVARLEAPLPAGVSLTIQLAAPSGATSRGQVALTTSDQEVVGPIPAPGSYAGLAIVYTHVATVSAGPLQPTARVVILTVTTGP
jgi:hypothetical protein